MKFRFNNYARSLGERGGVDYFKWKVFMDEPYERLAQVRKVQYRLHETFPQPIREVEDADSKFSLESSGWGEFLIYIIVYLKDGTEAYERYHLDLRKGWPSGG